MSSFSLFHLICLLSDCVAVHFFFISNSTIYHFIIFIVFECETISINKKFFFLRFCSHVWPWLEIFSFSNYSYEKIILSRVCHDLWGIRISRTRSAHTSYLLMVSKTLEPMIDSRLGSLLWTSCNDWENFHLVQNAVRFKVYIDMIYILLEFILISQKIIIWPILIILIFSIFIFRILITY